MNKLLGNFAPDFILVDHLGKKHKLSDYRGQWVVLYFYPKDNTPGCTLEACAFRDNYLSFQKEKIKIFGVSADSKESHNKFINKFNLPFTLLVDENRQVIKKYQVHSEKNFFGKKIKTILRNTFLINPLGKIVKIYSKFDIKQHPLEIINDIKNFKN